MLLTIFGFPIVTAQLTFDDDLLAFLGEGSEVSADLPHTVTSTKVVTCWRSPSPSLKNSLLAIVAEATGVPELVSLKVGLATRLPLMMMRLMFTSNVINVCCLVEWPSPFRLGPFAFVLQSLPESFGFRFGEKDEPRRNFSFQNGNAVDV